MCFSAGASFGAGVILTGLGVTSVRKAQTTPEKIFAGIPFLFAVQQISEGVLWIALCDPAYERWINAGTYSFLFFAEVLWPVWLPVSVYLMTPKNQRKVFQKILVGMGGIISLYLAITLLTCPVESRIDGNHILYTLEYPVELGKYGTMIYLLTTVAPAFFSPVKRMWTFGATILIAYIASFIFYTEYVLSVWCFFASLISLTVLFVLHGRKSEVHEQSIRSISGEASGY